MPRNPQTGCPCVFFDRDGVVNVSPGAGYVARWKDFEFRPGIESVLSDVQKLGWLRVLVTNQQGVAKRVLSEATLIEIHRCMQEQLAARGAAFDAIYAATGVEGQDLRRKPSPRMLQEAASDLGIDLTKSWMIGDDDRDILAGKRAGTRTIRLVGNSPARVPADFTVGSLPALRRLFESLLHPQSR